jgi:hypothetical protein
MATMVKIGGFTGNPQPVLDLIVAQGLTSEGLTLEEAGLEIKLTEDLDVAQEAALSAAITAAIFGVTFSKV